VRISIILGAVVSLTGILLGNSSADRMVDVSNDESNPEKTMFSTGAELDQPSVYQQRGEGQGKYLASHPDGPLYKRLRLGQALTIMGVLIWIIGIFAKF
jgi:hypothetical protein